jgi:serine/threonine protein kinase
MFPLFQFFLEFSSSYALGPIIGNGAFSEVKFGTHFLTGENFAIKIINVTQQTQGFDLLRIYSEIEILDLMNHPGIIK